MLLEDFWRVFCSRIDLITRGMVGIHGGRICQPRILEPHEYYFHKEKFSGCVDWPIGCSDGVVGLMSRLLNCLFLLCFPQQYEVPPFPIPNLTREVLAFLRPLPTEPSPEFDRSSRHLLGGQVSQLPVELQDMIYDQLHPFVNPSLECTRQISADIWRSLLFDGRLFPWLWDLDPSMLQGPSHTYADEGNGSYNNQNLPSYGASNFWDWERLVRELAQVEVFESGNLMEHAPLGLRNRRRIWRLLDEARVDDIKEYASRKTWERLWC